MTDRNGKELRVDDWVRWGNRIVQISRFSYPSSGLTGVWMKDYSHSPIFDMAENVEWVSEDDAILDRLSQ